MTSPLSATQAEDLRSQLYRYAQDIQDLMEQHMRLQARYQAVLQSNSRDSLPNDLLLVGLRQGHAPCLVTDLQGFIVTANATAQALLGAAMAQLEGFSLLQLAPHSQRPVLQQLLTQCQAASADEAAQLTQLSWFDGREVDSISPFDLLVMPERKPDASQLIWVFTPALPSAGDALTQLQNFNLLRHSSHGMHLLNAQRQVCAINAAACQITGFEPDALLGKLAPMITPEHSDSALHKTLWHDLQARGSWSGEVFNRRSSGQIYPEWKSLRLVKNNQGEVFATITVFADNAHPDPHSQQLSRMAYHDALTGLPNRRLFDDRLAQAVSQAQRDGSCLSLLFVDLDHFKPINDKLGHEVGDLVLKEVAQRMKRAIRLSDTVARIGGDEFVVLLQNTARQEDVQTIANNMLTRFSQPIVAGQHQLMVGASIGCARYPQDASDEASLIKCADAAMYTAKRFGGNHFSFYESGGDHKALANLGLDLWRAIDRNEFHLLYQPQVTPAGHLRGCEALIRWQHPVLGVVSPQTFIPIAETNGAILPLGDWVLSTACRQLRDWQRSGLGDLTMSVNVSPRQLRDPDFAQRVCSILLASGIEPAALELEITETEALQSTQDGTRRLEPLRALGIKIAIDDFGTGFSSLSRLQSMPIDRLKIDQSFVRDLADAGNDRARAISQCFVSMGKAMGMQVVAEGVETSEQLQVLTDQGCSLIQGYFTGKPMTGPALLATFANAASATSTL